MKLVFTKAAQRDLDNIALHIAKDNVDAALRVVVDIETRARLLLVTPSMGRRAAREGVRELVVDDYVLPRHRSPPRLAWQATLVGLSTSSRLLLSR